MFSLNGKLKKSGSVGRWETKQFIGMAYCERKIRPTRKRNFDKSLNAN